MILPTSICCTAAPKSALTRWPLFLLSIAAAALLLWWTSPASTESSDDVHSSPQVAVAARCVDLKPECFEWAADHQCRTNPQFMHHFCSASCKLCNGVAVSRPSGIETAAYGKPRATIVASQPRIPEPSSAPSSRIERPMVQRPAVEKPPVQRSAAKDVPAVDISAVDTSPEADRKVVERPAVEKPPSPPSADPQTKGCEDLHTRCEAWSKAGECERNPSFMVRECRRSCRLCPITSPSGRSAV